MIWLFILLIAWIAIALWPITLTLIGLFLLWLLLPRKELPCHDVTSIIIGFECEKKFRKNTRFDFYLGNLKNNKKAY